MPVADKLDLVQLDGGTIAEAMRRLGPWYSRAATGGIGLDEAAEAISACEGVVNALSAVIPHERRRLDLFELDVAFRLFRERMEPRLLARIQDEDGADLASLAALA